MKNINTALLTLFLIFVISDLSAYDVHIKGMVKDENGHAVSQHLVILTAAALDPNSGYYNELLTDADGKFEDEFVMPDGLSGVLVISTKSCRALVQQKFRFSEDASEIETELEICASRARCDVEIAMRQTNAFMVLKALPSGIPPFSYFWSTGDTTSSIRVNQFGEYCVKIVDSTGCVARACKEIEERDSCHVEIEIERDSTSFILKADAEGEEPLSYEWSTGDTTEMIRVDSLAKYCVTITDEEGCMARACTRFGDIDSCGVKIRPGRDSVSVLLSAEARGEEPFTYEWNTGDSTKTIRIDSAGEYCVKVIDSTGCEAEACFEYELDSCEVEIMIRRGGITNRLVLLAKAEGEEPLTYKWSTGDTTQTILVGNPGKYCVTVTDSTGCQARACKEVGLRDSCFVKILQKRDSNSVVLYAEGHGKEPLNYRWNTGDSTQRIRVDSPGTYCVVVTDSTGCQARACFDYGLKDSCSVEIIKRQTGAVSGVILIAKPNGKAPFTYLWSTGDSTETIRANSSGKYCVTVTDATGCQARACTEIRLRDACFVRILMKRDSTSAVLFAEAAGQAPIEYEWNTGDTTQRIRVDSPGTYCVVVTDSTGCQAKACVDFGRKDSCYVEIFEVRTGNGSIMLIAKAKGEEPFRFAWNTGDSTQNIRVDSAGMYCVTVTDFTGCQARACYQVGKVDSCSAEILARQTGNGALLVAVGNGRKPFTYEWSTGDTSRNIKVVDEGKYCVTITDANGCKSEACHEYTPGSNCSVKIHLLRGAGGTYLWARAKGTAPFKYEWSNGATGERILIRPEGEYCVTITDANGCVAKACFSFDRHGCNVHIIVRPTPDNRETRALTAKGTGKGPFTYEWSTGDTIQTIVVKNKGEYCVTVTNAKGCTARACIELPKDKRISHPRGLSPTGGPGGGGLKVFPNPSSDRIYLDATALEEADLDYVIINAYGKRMTAGKVGRDGLEDIFISDFVSGHYTIMIIGPDFMRSLSFFKN